MSQPIIEIKALPAREGRDCSDLDEDCEPIEDKVHCWLYDPARGMCPFLRNRGASGGADHG